MRFPLDHLPAESWLDGPRKFGAPRFTSGVQRKHPAIDLYGPPGTPVYAIEDGNIWPVLGWPPSTQQPYGFVKYRPDLPYVDAIEVHGASGIFRYCELKFLPEIRIGHVIKEGDLLGHMADMGIGQCMLHLEHFSGKGNGALSLSLRLPFNRRDDLLDPTELISRLAAEWEPKPLAAAGRA